MDDSNEKEGLGARFWLALVGICAGAAVAAGIIFAIFGRMWEAWGFFGAFIGFGLILIGIAWIYDRREKSRREKLLA
jgi:uncharacterized membrane protein